MPLLHSTCQTGEILPAAAGEGRWRPCRKRAPGSDRADDPASGITHAMNFEDIDSIDALETVSEEGVWQNFERLAAFIFEKNEYAVTVNTIKTLNRTRRQYDVIARKRDRTVLVECKKWAGSRYRLSALKRAVVQHKERTAFYKTVMHADAVPVIVTLIEEEILVYEGVPLVPVIRLDAFIRELDSQAGRNSFSFDEEEIFFAEDLPAEQGEFSGEGES